jgi:hypothetical protein
MKSFKKHIFEKLKVSSSSVSSDVEEKISNRRSKRHHINNSILKEWDVVALRHWIDEMIVLDDFVTVEPLDSLIDRIPGTKDIFWNYDHKNGTKPEIIKDIKFDGSMTYGDAYEIILRFIHDKYEDKDDIFTI